jgi:hypothetical protein
MSDIKRDYSAMDIEQLEVECQRLEGEKQVIRREQVMIQQAISDKVTEENLRRKLGTLSEGERKTLNRLSQVIKPKGVESSEGFN